MQDFETIFMSFGICSKIGEKKHTFYQCFSQSIIIMDMLEPEAYDTIYQTPLVRTKLLNSLIIENT